MSEQNTDRLVETLAGQARPVEPLAPPLRRAALTLVPVALVGAVLVLMLGDVRGMAARYAGREALMAVEMGAMLATALLGVTGAFMLSVPGRSRRWLLAPLPTFLLWFATSGLGCVGDLAHFGPDGWRLGSADCLVFILSAGVPIGGLMLWRLSRARPINPFPVALLGGLGAAALAAFLLQFFHPFGLTVVDLGLHFVAVLIVVALAALSRRRTLAPA
jgi:hypothetical protein